MNKVWKVFKYEYGRHVLRKRFIFAVLSLPLIMAFIMGVSIVSSAMQSDNRPVGYVDQSGLLDNPVFPEKSDSFFERPVELVRFDSETAAQTDLEADSIQGYFVLEPDYQESSHARLVFKEEPTGSVVSQFRELIQMNLLTSQPPEITQRVLEGSNLVIQSADGTREMGEDQWYNILIPLFAGILFMIVIFTSGGYLMQAVVEEKENRTMEIIVTSVSPDQLMAGKILGNLSVGLTQLIIWVLVLVIAVLVGRNYVPWIQDIRLSWDYLLLMAATLLPTFVMIGGLMGAIGATVTESSEAQTMSSMFTLPVMVPYWFTYQIMSNPNGPLAVGLSYFPLTAPITLTMRAAFTPIPAWQIAINVSVLVLCAVGSIWLAARAFRMGMLSYGKRISLKQLFSKAG